MLSSHPGLQTWRLGRLPSSSTPTEGILQTPGGQSEEAAHGQGLLQRSGWPQRSFHQDRAAAWKRVFPTQISGSRVALAFLGSNIPPCSSYSQKVFLFDKLPCLGFVA